MSAGEKKIPANKAPPPTKGAMRSYELHAQRIREKAGFGPTEAIDPLANVDAFGAVVRVQNSEYDARVWSGGAKAMPDGALFVMLNANQTRERMNVTFLEEIAHHYYDHTPVGIGPGGRAAFDEAVEKEALFTAAAALLPSVVVAKAVHRGETAKALGARYGASQELAEMRIKTLGLWRRYASHHSTGSIS